MMVTGYHKPVMLHEAISALDIHPEGVYVDATFGGGGHSLAILGKLKGGRLIAFDRDSHAAHEAERIVHRSLSFHEAKFTHMKKYLRLEGVDKVNGILVDLGVSSHQIDTPERGFSTRYDGPLDMRMDGKSSLTAAAVVNTYTEEELYRVFHSYGELRNAGALSRAIVQQRESKKIMRTAALTALAAPLTPPHRLSKYCAQVFQALRIEVNKEIEVLEEFMCQCADTLDTHGRLVAITYHSLEDRVVKRFMRYGRNAEEPLKDELGNPQLLFKELTRKPTLASDREVSENSRARSAKLRAAERI